MAKIANAKPRRRSRKNDIYERFITRVENVDSNDNEDGEQASGISGNGRLAPLKNADKLSSYEPLSAAELELFANQQEESIGVHLNFFDEDECLEVSGTASNEADLPYDAMEKEQASFSSTDSLDDAKHISKNHSKNDENIQGHDSKSTNENIDNDSLVVQSPTAFILSKDKKLASSKKPLIIGMIVGSLLIAAVVLTLIFTGFLSTNTSTEPALPANAGTPKSNSNSSGNKVVTASNMPEASNQSTVDAQTSVSSTGNKDLDNKNTTKNTQGANGQSTAATTNNSENESASEPAITYEDFREESQSTLYRETND